MFPYKSRYLHFTQIRPNDEYVLHICGVRQGNSRTQPKGIAIGLYSFILIFERVAPYLYCTQLSQSIFNIVERRLMDMPLPEPFGCPEVFKPTEINAGQEAIIKFIPLCLTFFGVDTFIRIFVDPMLEQIHQ